MVLAALLLVFAGSAAPTSAAARQLDTRWITWTDHGPNAGMVISSHRPADVPTAATGCPGAMSGTRPLTFKCVTGSGDTGWTASDIDAIGTMLSAAYARQVALYGPPAHGHVVTIHPDASLHDLAWYRASASVDGTGHVLSCRAVIHINPADGRSALNRIHYLTHEVLHAFHGCQAPPTPAVEEGMTESAASLLRASIAADLGIAWDRPSEPSGVYANQSGVTIADQYNGPLMSANRWYDTDDAARPQTLSLYADASSYWWTLWRTHSSFYRDWNSRWLAQDDLSQPFDTRLARVHAIAAQVAPQVGFMSYASWRAKQKVMKVQHRAGLRVLCADASTQSPDGFMRGLIQVIATDASHDDVVFGGDVDISLQRPNGSSAFNAPNVGAGAMDQYDFLFDHMSAGGAIDMAHAGAYRLTVRRSSDSSPIGDCWFIGGIRSSNRLVVVADPAQTVKVSVPKLVSGQVQPVTLTQAVGADRVAVFADVRPGLASVGLDGASPTRVVPIGMRGAVVALARP